MYTLFKSLDILLIKQFDISDKDIPTLFNPNEKTYNHLSGKCINMMRKIYTDKINDILSN